MSTVSIEIDSKWVKRTHSPLFRLVASLRGVAITSAPIFLYAAGKGWFGKYDYLVAASCFAAIWLVGFFYVLLGNEVIGELRNGRPHLGGTNFSPPSPKISMGRSKEEKARWVRLGLWAAVLAVAVLVWAISIHLPR